MVGSEQVYHPPVSHYGGSKPEVVNKKSGKPEHMVYLLFYTSRERNSNCSPPNIHVRTLHWCHNNDSKLRVSERKSEIQVGGFENSVALISADTHDSNKIPTAKPMFQATRIDYWEYCPMSGHVVYQRWRPLTGSR